jgi:hypothetical protein
MYITSSSRNLLGVAVAGSASGMGVNALSFDPISAIFGAFECFLLSEEIDFENFESREVFPVDSPSMGVADDAGLVDGDGLISRMSRTPFSKDRERRLGRLLYSAL